MVKKIRNGSGTMWAECRKKVGNRLGERELRRANKNAGPHLKSQKLRKIHAQDTTTLTVTLHMWIGVFGYNFLSLLFNMSNYSHLKFFYFN